MSDAVERAHRGNEIVAARAPAASAAIMASIAGLLDAHIVSGAVGVGGGAAPVEGLLVAGRERLVPAILDHVEIVGESAGDRIARHRPARTLAVMPARFRSRAKASAKPLLLTVGDQDLE